ncbi:MAG: hypothetical protein WD294_06530 [Phycisphaeraceae bacterium]
MMPTVSFRYLPLLAMLALMTLSIGCTETPEAHADEAHADEAHEHEEHGEHDHPELAPAMGELQRFSQKLGYSIEGENQPLAGFYIHELEEVFAEITAEIPEYDGHEIATLVQTMGVPVLETVEQAVHDADWPTALENYQALIASCNACHAATEHGFIQITPATGEPPFNQRFTPIE